MKVRREFFSILFSLLIFGLALAPVVGRAQQTSNPPDDIPPGVSFTVRLKDGKTQFYQGELITVEMLFSSKVPDQYQLYGGTYDRSGRFEADTFRVDPANGVTDPTAEYFHTSIFGFMSGGLSPGPITLQEKPYIIERDINELVRFDQPGHYRLSVTNSRIGKIVWHGRSKTVESLPATSNTIAFDVVPADPNWQKSKIQEAARVIKDKPRDARSACRTLRFMNAPEAEAAMIRLYSSGCEGEFLLGVVGSPRRAAIIEAMETQIAAPEYPVTVNFIHTLASLAFMREDASPLTTYPTNDPEKRKLWQAEAQKRREQFQEIVTRYTQQAAATVSRKNRPARAIALNTLLELESSTWPQQRTAANNAVLDQISSSLPELFLDLPPEQQYSLLSSHWKRLASPTMLPVLRQLAQKPPAPAMGSTLEDRFKDLRSLALKRLYQLAPDEGRTIILSEIARRFRRINTDVLEILPDVELPEVDELLAANIENNPPDRAFDIIVDNSRLIARYASANSLARVKAAASDRIGKMACDPQSSLLAYFLRVDPDYGATAVEQALNARGQDDTGCYRMAFNQVGRQFMSPGLEEIAIQHLDDSNREVAVQAITLLGQRGSAAAEKPLWNRLERWHTEWQARAEEAQPQMENGIAAGEPARFEFELVGALVKGTAWTLDADQLKRIEQLCLTPTARLEVQSAVRFLDDHRIQIVLSPSDDPPLHISIGGYQASSISSLKEKLSSMPKGTHFTCDCEAEDANSAMRLFQELKSFLTVHGMTLDKSEK